MSLAPPDDAVAAGAVGPDVAPDVGPDVEDEATPSLSPSRAGDFRSCPLRFRLRTVDRIPEPPSHDAARGTLVHAVLERLMELPAARRVPAEATDLVRPALDEMLTADPELVALVGETGVDEWLAPVQPLLDNYFTLEDPRCVGPGEREQLVEARLPWGLTLRGYVDRLDVAPTGELRVVDYKSGRAPSEAFAARAMFQLRFYALTIWRARGVLPSQLLMLYLRDAQALTYAPSASELEGFERTLASLWRAIDAALDSGDFRPNKGPLCGWCDFRALCPAWEGTPPPYPGRRSAAPPVTAR